MPMTQEDITKYKALYLQAAKDNLNNLQKHITQLSQGIESEELYESTHREAHSLKSESLLMGYTSMGELAATIEIVFEERKATNTSLSRDVLSLIDQSVKEMLASLDEIKNNNKEIDLSAYIQQLKDVAKL